MKSSTLTTAPIEGRISWTENWCISSGEDSDIRLMATALARADTRDLLPNIGVPTLLIWGDQDARSPMEVAHQLHDAILDSRLAVISGVGHISNLEDPARFNAEVRQFCLSVPS
jgi:pimeloyl-ACP methyl ester carboxylesterase